MILTLPKLLIESILMVIMSKSIVYFKILKEMYVDFHTLIMENTKYYCLTNHHLKLAIFRPLINN